MLISGTQFAFILSFICILVELDVTNIEIMSISFSKHPKYPDQILTRTFSGAVNSSDIINSWEQLRAQHLITPNILGMVNDLTNCDLELDLNQFKEITTYLKSYKKLKSIKLAVVTSSPDIIVFPMLLESLHKTLNFKAFSTFEAAENWVLEGI